jgi:hypothetical protein
MNCTICTHSFAGPWNRTICYDPECERARERRYDAAYRERNRSNHCEDCLNLFGRQGKQRFCPDCVRKRKNASNAACKAMRRDEAQKARQRAQKRQEEHLEAQRRLEALRAAADIHRRKKVIPGGYAYRVQQNPF